jgi:uncharacterized protein (DUF2235 family)
MSKNILICLDGTKNEVKANAVTNVLKIAEVADLAHPDEQVLYYDPGVGTKPAPSAFTRFGQRFSLLGGMALGWGMRDDIAEAYTYLMKTWQPGDKVFIFGFSRGAFTARALCGLLYRIGLLRPGSENLVWYAVREYARQPGEDSDLNRPEGWDRIDKFSEVLAIRPHDGRRSFLVEYLGIFDTVKALSLLGRDVSWPYTRKLPNVGYIRHAISIDENRRLYPEYRVLPDAQSKYIKKFEEAWFAGVHSDVGGGFPDNPELGLISMRWILDGAIRRGLKVNTRKYDNRYGKLNDTDACAPMHATGSAWRFAQPPWYWVFRPRRSRPIPDGATIHGSVEIRRGSDKLDYRPKLPANYHVDDGPWTGPAPAPDPEPAPGGSNKRCLN